jgi:hypothetical protein
MVMVQPQPPLTNQRMFHGHITAAALAGQLAAHFADRQHHTHIEYQPGAALFQVGSPHGTPLTVHFADTQGGVLATASRGRDWLDRTADAGDVVERAASNPLSFLTLLPDVIGELRKDNLLTDVWTVVNDIMGLTRALAGEEHAPQNPKICPYCGRANDPGLETCVSCGGVLPVNLPRICPKCGRAHTSDALFCQACGTRLVEEKV